MPEAVALGMVHGRFQPFHNGHLAYLRGASARARRLVVGITNADVESTRQEPADPRRHLPEENPSTFDERRAMVEAVLADEGIEDARIVPFPISYPERLAEIAPAGTVHFLRVFDDWGTTKVERLRRSGYEVVVLDEGAPKEISGAKVRALLRARGDWESLVPPGTARVLRSLRRAP